MNQNEQTRLKVLNSVMVGQLPVAQAAELLGVSERHVWRVLAAYRREGAAALVHGNRGRRPANATSEAAIADVLRLATTRYSGTNHTHLSELLMEREGIALSRSTVRRIALSAGVTSPRRRRSPRHRVRRKRMPQAGMLVQINGSHHRWLEGRGPSFALLLAVDDATSTVPYALFQPEEDARGYLMLMEGLIQRSGIPLAVYSDRHAVFKHPGEPRQKLPGPTQFARAMQQLGIRQIFARSPQAKGRVERTAGTFQDRLVTELRLARVETIDDANAVLHRYLPRFDRQFGVPAAQSEVAYRPPETATAVEQALCFRYRRNVAKDNTVKYRWRTLQLLPGQEWPSYAGVRVEVLERPDGRLLVEYKGRLIPTQEAPPRPSLMRVLSQTPSLNGSANGSGYHHHPLAALESRGINDAKSNRPSRARKHAAPMPRKPTPRQVALWEAVQEAKVRGLSIRGIARELGIHRNTARKYAAAERPPVMALRNIPVALPDTMNNNAD